MITGSYDPERTVSGGLEAEVMRLAAQAELSFHDEWRAIWSIGIPSGPIIEVGAGTGEFLRRLRTRLPARDITGLEINPQLQQIAQASAIPVYAGSAYELPLADHSVSALIYRFVFQHLQDTELALSEALRVLRPGGKLLVIDVDAGMWGAVEPRHPGLGLAAVERKLATAQRNRSGNRLVTRGLARAMTDTGFTDSGIVPYATSSDTRPLKDFEDHVGPGRLVPLLASGEATLHDIATVTQAWARLCADPDAWVCLMGFVVWGSTPHSQAQPNERGRSS